MLEISLILTIKLSRELLKRKLGLMNIRKSTYELHNDEKSLFIQQPSFEPQATRYIPEMIELIEKLVEKDYAYISETGDGILLSALL